MSALGPKIEEMLEQLEYLVLAKHYVEDPERLEDVVETLHEYWDHLSEEQRSFVIYSRNLTRLQ